MSVPRIPRIPGRVRLPAAPVVPAPERVPSPRSPRSPAAPASGTMRVEAEALIADIRKRRARIADDFYEIGKALDRLADPRVFRALGHASFEELLAHRKLMTRVQAHKLIVVARTYPKALALRLGIEKAYGLHRYVMATPAADLAAELARRDARIGGRAISVMTIKEMSDAIKRVTTGVDTREPIPAAVRRRASALQRALRARGAKSAKVRAERVGVEVVFQIRIAPDDSDALLP